MTDAISQFEEDFKLVLSHYKVNLYIKKGDDKQNHLVAETPFYKGDLYLDNFMGDVRDNRKYVDTHVIKVPIKE